MTVIIAVVMSVGVTVTQSKCVFSQRSRMTALAVAVVSLPISDIAVDSGEPKDFRTSLPLSEERQFTTPPPSKPKNLMHSMVQPPLTCLTLRPRRRDGRGGLKCHLVLLWRTNKSNLLVPFVYCGFKLIKEG